MCAFVDFKPIAHSELLCVNNSAEVVDKLNKFILQGRIDPHTDIIFIDTSLIASVSEVGDGKIESNLLGKPLVQWLGDSGKDKRIVFIDLPMSYSIEPNYANDSFDIYPIPCTNMLKNRPEIMSNFIKSKLTVLESI
jgi:hypothetical protein